jgi:hypothetical protein
MLLYGTTSYIEQIHDEWQYITYKTKVQQKDALCISRFKARQNKEMKFGSYLLLSDADILSFQFYKENSICVICRTVDESQILGLVDMDDSYFSEQLFQSLSNSTLESQYSKLVSSSSI